MKTGFTYKGIHSDVFGVTLKTQDRPIIPSVKSTTYSALCMDGLYDFSAANSYGREFYDEREFSLAMQISGDNLRELNKKMQKITAWLMGSGKLIFDDTPLAIWTARCGNSISFAPELRGKKAIITAKFSVSPFAQSAIGSGDVILDTAVELDSNLPLDISEYYSQSFVISSSTGTLDFTIPNFGDRPIRPIITVTLPDYSEASKDGAYISGITFSNGDNSLTVSGIAGVEFTADFDNQVISADENAHSNLEISGEFFELSGASPVLSVAVTLVNNTSDSVNCNVSAEVSPEVIWDVDLSDYDWGD